MTAAGECKNYNSDIMQVQEVRQKNSSNEKVYNYTTLCGNENKNHLIWIGFSYKKESY